MQDDRKSPRILVIDEDEGSAGALVDALSSAGYAACAAHTIAGAVRALQEAPRELAVVSIGAPASSSLAVAATLRQQFDVPLLFISARAEEETVSQATALGALAYLVRPRDMLHCVPTVRTALARAEELRRSRVTETQVASAVHSNRLTGTAVGILVERLRVNRQEAFELLRDRGRSNRRSVMEIAEDLVTATERVNGLAHRRGMGR